MPLQGDVATLPVRDLLELLVRTRASGRLSVSRGMAARRFHLRDGQVMLASSSEEATLLGRLLVERGLIDEVQLAGALNTRKGASARTRLGKTLTDSGLVSPAQLSGVLADKIERLLLDTMNWRDGRFYFDEEAAPRRQAVVTAVDLGALLQRPGARFSRQDSPDTFAVSDADVIEVRPLAGPGGPSAPAPVQPVVESRTRRRRRRAAVA
jgi:hypothetical protein